MARTEPSRADPDMTPSTDAVRSTTRMAIPLSATCGVLSVLVSLGGEAAGGTGWGRAVVGLVVNIILFEWTVLLQKHMPLWIPARYFSTRRFEHIVHVYERLGIRAFGRLLAKSNGFAGSRTDLTRFERGTRHAETVHLVPFVGVTVFAACMSTQGRFGLAVWAMVFNIPVNVYPMMLQRYNRVRIQRILDRIERSDLRRAPAELRRSS